MAQIRIDRPALDEVRRALDEYDELLARRRADGVIKENTRDTYSRYARMFVRWLEGDFDPGARNEP